MLFASLAEILSIGSVLPFLGVLTAPEHIFELRILQPVIEALKISKASQLLLPITIIFVLSAIIAGFMRILLLWAGSRLSYAAGADISMSVYRRTLYQPYSVHCARNSSEVINGITSKTTNAIYIMVSLINLISSFMMLLAILLAMLFIDSVVAILAFGGFGFIYLVIVYFSRKSLLDNGQITANESTKVIKSLQEGLGGIRDVLIDGSQPVYCQIYRDSDLLLRRAQGKNMFISSYPRYAMEALGMALIAILAYSLAQQADGIVKAVPILGSLALGAQRVLPVLQQIYFAWAAIQSGQASLKDTLELLEQPLPDYSDERNLQKISFVDKITIKNLNFRYNNKSAYVLNNLNLNIKKGTCVGFIGTTGSGKSTLLDIVMGLLQPTDGSLQIDGVTITETNRRSWQIHISHVPQSIFLADATIEENIAFGVQKDLIDFERVEQVSMLAQISKTIERLPKKYQTFVGERGVRLSGGQRQRIGIARALYKQAEVIVLDEATSALDNETEQSVMTAIEGVGENLTLLIIAHRLSTLKNCSKIVELCDGKISRIGSYEDIVKFHNIN
jgi:ATP-binding cassette subfamily B protein